TERTFQRKLDPDRMKALEARSVPLVEPAAPLANAAGSGQKAEPGSLPRAGAPQPVAPVLLSSIAEHEPNDLMAQALEISIPVIVEGAIQRPGDIDSFKFKVKAGQRLAFEIE